MPEAPAIAPAVDSARHALPSSASSLEPALTERPATTAAERLVSLDAYRGLIMLTLLCGGIFHSFKGDPSWNWLFVQNEHVEWDGCTYWDLIQPSFMFMVGVAIPFAFARRTALGESWARQFGHALIRAFELILIGVLLDHIGSETIRIGFIRVLQQIAFGYVAVFFLLGRSLRTQALVAAATLVGYQLLWMCNPWNGSGGPWAKGNENIGSAFDLWMIGRNYSGFYVGMNAIPSGVTILLGAMAGRVVAESKSRLRTFGTLVLWGTIGVIAGWALGLWFPLIKRIWTPSFTVFSAGCTTLILAAFYGLTDLIGWRKWAFPLVVVGTNSIAAYIMPNAFGGWFRGFSKAWIAPLRDPLGEIWFPVFQHALFAGCCWVLLYWLYRRRIFIKL